MAASVPTQSTVPVRVPTSTSAATLLASNGARKMVIIHNDSAGVLYVKYGAGASATDFTYRLASQTALEMTAVVYGGVISGALDTGTGNAQVTAY